MTYQREPVERKLSALAGYVAELRPLCRIDLATYQRQGTVRRAVERLLQLCAESAADACAALLAAGGRPPATHLRAQFTAAAELGAIPEDLAARLGLAAGLRDRIVHDCDRLDDQLVWAAARAAVVDFPAFIAALAAYLARHDLS